MRGEEGRQRPKTERLSGRVQPEIRRRRNQAGLFFFGEGSAEVQWDCGRG